MAITDVFARQIKPGATVCSFAVAYGATLSPQPHPGTGPASTAQGTTVKPV